MCHCREIYTLTYFLNSRVCSLSTRRKKMITEEQFKSIRNVRVIYRDPYATDLSSEDETPTDNNGKGGKGFAGVKQVVKEIVLEKVDRNLIENRKTRRSSSRHRGVRRKNSKFVSEIRDPFSGKRIWLGTYETEEEAAAAFNRKNREFKERASQRVDSCLGSSANLESSAETKSCSRIRQQSDLRNSDDEFLEYNVVPHSPREECQLDQEMNIWFDDEFRQQWISELMGNPPILPLSSRKINSESQNDMLNKYIRKCFKSLRAERELKFCQAENEDGNNFPENDSDLEEQLAWVDEVLNKISQ